MIQSRVESVTGYKIQERWLITNPKLYTHTRIHVNYEIPFPRNAIHVDIINICLDFDYIKSTKRTDVLVTGLHEDNEVRK